MDKNRDQHAGARTLGAEARKAFSLEEGGIFLNNGSFGAVPVAVQAEQTHWRDAMERQPDVFFRRLMKPAIRAAADALAPLIGARGDDLALLENPTLAINTVLQRWPFAAGDEILVTSTTYNAVRISVADVCRRTGARMVVAPLPFPVDDPAAMVDAIMRAVTPRTRLAVIDHIVSPTGFLLPVAEIAARLRARNIRVLIDGAHGPGQIALDVSSLGVDWYTGTLHKWLFAPRGTAFLWAAAERRAATLPLQVSHWFADGFPRAFDYTGTRDATAWLCVPAAIAFAQSCGLSRIMAHNCALAEGGAKLFHRLGAKAAASPSMFAAMHSLILPARAAADASHATELMDRLWDEARVQVAVSATEGALLLRLSAQIYVTMDDFAAAAHALDRLGWPGRV